MNVIPGGAPERRSPGDPSYDVLAVFKLDLRAITMRHREGELPPEFPGHRRIAQKAGLGSPATSHAALTPDDLKMPKEDTVRAIASEYDPEGVDYWIERRERVDVTHRKRAASDTSSEPSPQSTAEEALDRSTTTSNHTDSTTRTTWVLGAVAAATAVVVVAATAVALNRDHDGGPPDEKATESTAPSPESQLPEPSDTADEINVPTDYSDPVAAGCVDAGSKRLKTESVEAVGGLVSVVYSAACDAYWARAERTDGLEIGNRIELTLTPQGSERSPVSANDPNAAAIYTYLLTGGDASGFCVDATFWVDQQRNDSPRICVPLQ